MRTKSAVALSRGHPRPRSSPPKPRWRLLLLWRLLVFSGGAAGLGWLLLEKGWWLERPSQVVFHGARPQDREALLAASGLQFPTPLLAVDPSALQRNLQRLLPSTLQVRVRRTMAPPRLVVNLRNGAAMAWVRRSSADGVEGGFLDHQFRWNRFDPPRHGARPQRDRFPVVRNNVVVLADFWSPRLPETLAEFFSALESLETPVNTIRIKADGQWVLGTSEVPGEVRLGQPEDLARKLAAMDRLYLQLGRSASPLSYAYVDLRNPDQPELVLSEDQGRSLPGKNGHG